MSVFFSEHVLTVQADIAVLKVLPHANVHAERFVLTIRSESNDRLFVFGERHLRHLLKASARHYNGQRPHRRRSRW